MRDKAEILQEIEETLPQLDRLLLDERGQSSAVPPDAQAQWNLFRVMANTRMPVPASAELVELQDKLLQDILEYRGSVELEDIPPVEGHKNIRLWRGDITLLNVDAVVNAANSQMLGCFMPGHHCIDNAIHTFAGLQLRLECRRLMEKQGQPEPTGMAKVTDAYNLPSNHIIHTVGPITEGEITQTDRDLLADCYTACLDAALDTGCKSIAFCCISTGVFGFPPEEGAKIAITTVEKWLADNDYPLEVVFDVFSDEDERLYHELLA